MAKRGRKPSPKKRTGYFYEEEEQAVLDYLNTDSKEEKNQIYTQTLRPAFEKMAESIIRRYKLYIPNESFEDTFYDTLSFLMTKLEKYKPEKGKKAYSYFGTICKNHVKGRIEDYQKDLMRNPSYDSVVEEFSNNIEYSDQIDRGAEVAKESVAKFIDRVNKMVENPKDFDLKESEIRLGKAYVKLLENWEYVLSTEGSNKLNKNAILLFLRETTGLDTKGIRDGKKKFEKEYLLIKNEVIS